MGRIEVCDFLKNNNTEWFDIKQLSDNLNLSYVSVCKSVKAVLKSNDNIEVKYIKFKMYVKHR